jgi:amidase
MGRSVKDIALLMNAIATGPDPVDNYTLAQPTPVPDYTALLSKDALKGVRLGIPQHFINYSTPQATAFLGAVEVLKGLGATIVDANITNIDSWNNGTLRNYMFGGTFVFPNPLKPF